ncbi:hypothetical protein [Rhizohabitans arisaemae]|uniref:hypothetical protein n=1 Tax=Rhizohabitans arisaemae TaxID=2720610 RepID=UPI0024B08598|nr:hypothetical protein [Rhizohabitans arisaemae]
MAGGSVGSGFELGGGGRSEGKSGCGVLTGFLGGCVDRTVGFTVGTGRGGGGFRGGLTEGAVSGDDEGGGGNAGASLGNPVVAGGGGGSTGRLGSGTCTEAGTGFWDRMSGGSVSGSLCAASPNVTPVTARAITPTPARACHSLVRRGLFRKFSRSGISRSVPTKIDGGRTAPSESVAGVESS